MIGTRRVLRRVLAGDGGRCRCGLRRAYAASITMLRPNSHGLLVDVTVMRSFCTVHGKLYAKRWNLEIQDAATVAE